MEEDVKTQKDVNAPAENKGDEEVVWETAEKAEVADEHIPAESNVEKEAAPVKVEAEKSFVHDIDYKKRIEILYASDPNKMKASITGILAILVVTTAFLVVLSPVLAISSVLGVIVTVGFVTYSLVAVSKFVYNEKYEELDKEKYAHVYSITRELSARAGIAMPSLYMVDEDDLNAMTSGFTQKSAKIIFTKLFLENLKLNDAELSAVIAHEIGHIVNKDYIIFTALQSVIAFMQFISNSLKKISKYMLKGTTKTGKKIVGPLVIIAFVASLMTVFTRNRDMMWMALVGLFIIIAVFMLIIYVAIFLGIAAAILAAIVYVCTFFTNMFSRQREYAADNFSKNLVGDARPVTSALAKLESWFDKYVSMRDGWIKSNPNVSIVNCPVRSIMDTVEVSEANVDEYKTRKIRIKSKIDELFKLDHPLTEKRIKVLAEPKVSKMSELINRFNTFFNKKMFGEPKFSFDVHGLIEHRNSFENCFFHSVLFGIALVLMIHFLSPVLSLIDLIGPIAIGAGLGVYNAHIVLKNAFDVKASYLFYRASMGGFIVGYVTSLILTFIDPNYLFSFFVFTPLALAGTIPGSLASYYALGRDKNEEIKARASASFEVLPKEVETEKIEVLMRFMNKNVAPVFDAFGAGIGWIAEKILGATVAQPVEVQRMELTGIVKNMDRRDVMVEVPVQSESYSMLGGPGRSVTMQPIKVNQYTFIIEYLKDNEKKEKPCVYDGDFYGILRNSDKVHVIGFDVGGNIEAISIYNHTTESWVVFE